MLRVLAERTGCVLGHKLREGCQVEMALKIQEELESTTSLRDAPSAAQTTPWPFSGRVYHG